MKNAHIMNALVGIAKKRELYHMPGQDTTSSQLTIRRWLPQHQYCLELTPYVDVASPRQPLEPRCLKGSMLLIAMMR
eukprot:12899902-Prorocentrum_lima.AAC.1